MNLEIRRSAIKDLKRIDAKNRKSIEKKLLELKNYPRLSNIKKLTNFEPAYRLRTGKYRILFDVSEDKIFIGRILHRKESYR